MNTNLFKALVKDMVVNRENGVEIDLCVVGSKGAAFFRNFGGNVVAAISHLGEEPSINDLIGSVKVMLDAYMEGKIDTLYVVYNRFVNTMKQEPTLTQLLPLVAESADKPVHHWDYIYEPDAKSVVDGLLTRYIEALIYQAVAENMASEQSARMVAMKAASDNAKSVIEELKLVYNKTRQAAITKELSEIVAGAAAV